MKHERVHATGVDLATLFTAVESHLKEQELHVTIEEDTPDYKVIRGVKRGVLRTLIGAVREAEVDLSRSSDGIDVTLRTGAWGRDIAIPAIEGFVLLGGVGALGGAGVGALMAHEFEQKFWKWLEETVRERSGGAGTMGSRFTPPMVPPAAIPGIRSSSADSPSPNARKCQRCGSPQVAGARFCHSCGAAPAG